jgi:sugar lactone lactonase YvrE
MRQLRTVACFASLLLSAAASAQQGVINTFAGGGPNNVLATSANVPYPVAVAVDSFGNYYFATSYLPEIRVFKVNASGTLTVFAGNGYFGYSGDGGPAAQAELNNPRGMAADSFGNVYIADTYNGVIRKVDATGAITTIAGTPGVGGYGGDGGPATSAYLNGPCGVAVDSSGNVYIADSGNGRIREVTVSKGEINTVAGNGAYCTGGGAACGDGGPATSAGFGGVQSLGVDGSGNVYIADWGNNEIRKFSVGGNISTVAGNGTWGFSGDGGPATSAELAHPYAVAVDSPGNIFIADASMQIREVTVSTGFINAVAGGGTGCPGQTDSIGDGCWATKAELWAEGVAVDSSDDIFIADSPPDDIYNENNPYNAIREVTDMYGTPAPVFGFINTVAGNGTFMFTGNRIPAGNAVLNRPSGAASDSAGNIYIADTENCVVRQVSAASGIITTFAGTPASCGYGGDGGPATSGALSGPSKVAVYAGNVYIADTYNGVIREVDATGVITTIAGTPGVAGYGGDGGPATSAYLNGPCGVAVDSSGNVYIADADNNRIREVSGGIIQTVAGNGTAGYSGDGGAATGAELDSPEDVAVDASGNLFIADPGNSRVRRVDASTGIITTVAGNGTFGFRGDGSAATSASLNFPIGVAVDPAGDVLIADTFNNRIRWVDGQGIIHTLAGNGSFGFSGDGGPGTSAMLAGPSGVGVDPSGNIYIADTMNSRIRMVNALAGLNASTTSVTFGSQAVGAPSGPASVTLSAFGPLEISNIAVTGDFSESDDCPTNATMSGQCVMNIVFKPTLGGTRTGTLTITDNGYFSSSLVISLSGTGVEGWLQMPGAFSQVSVGSDGTVWGINSTGQVYMFNPQTQTWQPAPGLFTQIAVGASGFVWALNAAGQIYRYDPALQGWDQIPGTLSQIAVGSDGDVWGINSSAQVYHFNSATETWTQIPGALVQIAVGYDGAVWGINAAQQIYRFNPGTQNWQQIPGALKQIAVGADGDVWGINNAGQIYHFDTLTQGWDNAPGSLAQIAVGSASNVWGINSAGAVWCFNAQTQAWNQTPGQLAQIAVAANGAVWGVNGANQIYQFAQLTQPTQTFHQAPGLFAQIAAGLDGEVWAVDATQEVWRYNAQLQSWQPIPGALTEICVGFGGNVWGLTAAGQILHFNASTQTWNQIPGSLAQLEVGADGSVWGIDSADRIWRFNPSTQAFEQIAGSLAQLAVGADGTVWGINRADQVYRFNPATQGWVQIPGSLAQIAVGSANNVWGLNAAGQIYQFNSSTQTWNQIPGSLAQLAVAFDGTVWGLNSANQIWRFNAATQSWDSIPGALAQVSVGADAVVWGLNAAGQAYKYW